MYCKKCGKKLNDGTKFCIYCGEKQQSSSQQTALSGSKKNHANLKKYKKVGIIAIIVVLAWFLVPKITGRGYKETIKLAVQSIETVDAAKMANLLPEEMANYMTVSTLEEELLDSKEDIRNHMGSGIALDDIKLSYNIKSQKEYSKEELQELKKLMYAGNAGYPAIASKVKDAMDVELEIIASVKNDKQGRTYTDDQKMTLYKIKNDWYVLLV